MDRFFGASLILGHFVKSGVGPILEFGLTLTQQCLLGTSNKKGQTTHDVDSFFQQIYNCLEVQIDSPPLKEN